MRGWLVAALIGGFALAAVLPASGANQDVSVSCCIYTPKTVTVTQGDTVTWDHAGGLLHDVSFDDESFKQPSTPSGDPWTVSRTFNAAGTFPYYCSIHGSKGGVGMSGSVVVKARPSETTTGAGGTGTTPVSPQVGPLGAETSCKSLRRFRIRIRRPGGIRIKSARVSLNSKQLAVAKRMIDGKLRHTAEVDLRGLATGTYQLEIDVLTSAGKRLRGKRTYRTCAPKQTPAALPRL